MPLSIPTGAFFGCRMIFPRRAGGSAPLLVILSERKRVEGSSHRLYCKCSGNAKILRLPAVAQDDSGGGVIIQKINVLVKQTGLRALYAVGIAKSRAGACSRRGFHRRWNPHEPQVHHRRESCLAARGFSCLPHENPGGSKPPPYAGEQSASFVHEVQNVLLTQIF